MNTDQLNKMQNQAGFIAALDQSGGSTPKALSLYGVGQGDYSGDKEMFDAVHAMRTRIIVSPSFSGNRILGAILFQKTMDSDIQGKPTAQFLWEEKRIVPILKVDEGLAQEDEGVQLMNPMPGLNSLLNRAKSKGIFGTKMRSVIKLANAGGIENVIDQQFEIGQAIMASGFVPIIEPEVAIDSPEKAQAEAVLHAGLVSHLDSLSSDQKVMLKLTLPDTDNLYSSCVSHPNVLRVVALSGGYSREEANNRLSKNNGMIASFSRALSEGLLFQQTDEEFDARLDSSIANICEASST